MADNYVDCHNDTSQESQMDVIADSGDKEEDICYVDTSSETTMEKIHNNPQKTTVPVNVSNLPNSVTNQESQMGDTADSGDKEDGICNVDTPSYTTNKIDNNPEEIANVSNISYSNTSQESQTGDNADSKDNEQGICNVDTPSDTTKDKIHNNPDETVVTANVSNISYSIEEVVCITGAWNDFRLREECFTKGCKWAPDGTCVVTNSVDNILRIYDLPPELHCQETWEKDRNLSELKSVLSISVGQQVYDYSWYPLMTSWNPLSCCLVSTSKDNPVHMWDAFTGELRCTYRCFNHMDEVVTPHCVSFNTTGEKLYCGLKNMIKIFDTSCPGRNCETRNLKMPMYQNETKIGIVSCIAVNPNLSSVYAVGTYLKTVGLYSEPDGQLLCFLKGQKGGVTHLGFSPDGTKLLSGGRKDSEIICWDLRNPGNVLFVLQREVATNQRIYFDISPNGCYVMSGGTNGIVKIWDIHRPPDTSLGDPVLHPLKSFVAHNDCVNGLSIHKQYPVLATSSGQRHFDDLFSDSSSDTDQSSSECDSDCRITKVKTKSENSLKLWWVGPKKQ